MGVVPCSPGCKSTGRDGNWNWSLDHSHTDRLLVVIFFQIQQFQERGIHSL